MSKIKVGCQAYTWQMSGEKYVGKIPEILDAVAQGGYDGFETEICMLGDYRDHPERFKEELEKRNLKLAALALALEWKDEELTGQEASETEWIMDYLSHFDGACLGLCQLPGRDRVNLRQRQQILCKHLNRTARMASDKGLKVGFHPNSPEGSVIRIEEDYRFLFDNIDSEYLKFIPDAGHIANGNMDAISLFKENVNDIVHVHFKDLDKNGNWVAMGEGAIDFPGIVGVLQDADYDGWIVVEDESEAGARNPAEVVGPNCEYVRGLLS